MEGKKNSKDVVNENTKNEEIKQASSIDKPQDPFDPKSLRLSQDFANSLGVEKKLITVPVRKPAKEWWVQVHPDESYRIETAVIELKEDREIYLVNPALWPELATESTFSPRALFTAVNRQGVVFIWPIKLPGSEGRTNHWNTSHMEAARLATGKWVRMVSNMSLGAYEVTEATADPPKAKWPKETFNELLKIGFKDNYIDSLDHPALKKLRGEI